MKTCSVSRKFQFEPSRAFGLTLSAHSCICSILQRNLIRVSVRIHCTELFEFTRRVLGIRHIHWNFLTLRTR